jgi:low affinity Fe/Cu permease
MKTQERGNVITRLFGQFCTSVAGAAGRPLTFVMALSAVAFWAVAGPVFGFSESWQLFINTGTTIVTFLMVFLIQNSQNRDNAAIQVKLDELIRSGTAQNFFVGIEHLTHEEIEEIRHKCETRSRKRRVGSEQERLGPPASLSAISCGSRGSANSPEHILSPCRRYPSGRHR